jgi:hypothetical protein
MMEMIPCSVVIKEFDKRKRIIRTKQNALSAISTRSASDGIHVIIHMGGKSQIFFSSEIEGKKFCLIVAMMHLLCDFSLL